MGAVEGGRHLRHEAMHLLLDQRVRLAAGIAEVILYFNYGRKPHALVKEQMHRFMAQVAPAFDGAHRRLAAE